MMPLWKVTYSSIIHAGDEDEVEIGPLRIEVRGMRHAHGIRTALDVGAHPFMQAVEVVPGDAGLQRIDQDAVIAQILAHVWFGVTGMFPFTRGITGQIDSAMFTGDALDLARHQSGVVPVAFDIAQAQAALHGLEPPQHQEGIHKTRHTIEFQAPVGFLRVGDAIDGGLAELGLHDLAAGVYRGLPGGVHEAEALPVFGHVTEDLHGDLDQDAEGAFRTFHDVVYLGAGGRGRDNPGS